MVDMWAVIVRSEDGSMEVVRSSDRVSVNGQNVRSSARTLGHKLGFGRKCTITYMGVVQVPGGPACHTGALVRGEEVVARVLYNDEDEPVERLPLD